MKAKTNTTTRNRQLQHVNSQRDWCDKILHKQVIESSCIIYSYHSEIRPIDTGSDSIIRGINTLLESQINKILKG